MLRVLTLSTLFPDATRPNFGVFVERQTLGLAAREDVDLRVVAPIGLPPWPFSHHPGYRAFAGVPIHEPWHGLDVHRPRFLNFPGTGGRFHAATLAAALLPLLRRIRRDFPFDLIAAEFFHPDGLAAVRLGRALGVPVTIKARGADIHFWGKAPGTAAQVLRAGREADALFAVSSALRRDMIDLGMPGDRIELSYTGVDLDRFVPRNRAEGKAALDAPIGPLVLSVGALIPRKGHDIVIDAVARLPGVALWIAGEGPERARLAALIEQSGAAGRIRLLGAVPHADLPPLFAAADVLALASSSEGLANVWVEALASGTPLVIPDIGGARELVRQPASGRIAERNPEAFAAAITALLTAPPDPFEAREAALCFTWPANAEALVTHYRSLLAGTQAAPAR